MAQSCLPLLLISVLAYPTTLPAADCAVAIPQRIAHNSVSESHPAWVSASAMTRADGSVDWSLIRTPALFNLVEGSTSDDCEGARRVTPVAPPGHREPANIAELVTASSGVFDGRVVAIEPGAYLSSPGFLLNVAVAEWLHAEGTEQLACLYVFFPAGSFRLGPHRVCVNHAPVPSPPAVGDRLLVALNAGAGPFDDLGMIFAPSPKGLFLQRSNGHLEYSSDWRGQRALAGIANLEQLRALFRRMPREPDH